MDMIGRASKYLTERERGHRHAGQCRLCAGPHSCVTHLCTHLQRIVNDLQVENLASRGGTE